MVDRLESLFHPEMRHQLSRRDDPSMCNLETRFPGHQLDFCPPDRADQHETFLRTREAHATTEAEEPCVTNDGTGLLTAHWAQMNMLLEAGNPTMGGRARFFEEVESRTAPIHYS